MAEAPMPPTFIAASKSCRLSGSSQYLMTCRIRLTGFRSFK
jgi:hypothetical protein